MSEQYSQKYRRFVAWETASRDTIDFKKIYADMAGEVLAGLLLSQIIYWHLPDKYGNSKLRVERDGYLWLAKSAKDWWSEIRLTEYQARRALSVLEKKGLIVTEVHKFNGVPTKHIRISDDFVDIWDNMLSDSVIAQNANGNGLEPNSDLGSNPNRNGLEPKSSYRDYLTETTKEEEPPPPDTRSPSSLTAELNGPLEKGIETTVKEIRLEKEGGQVPPNSAAESVRATTTTVECALHPGVCYTRYEKGGDVWFAHRMPDGTFCRKSSVQDPEESAEEYAKRTGRVVYA